MSQNTREFIEQLKEPQSMGAIEAMATGLTEGVKAFLDGAGKVWDAAQPMVSHGCTEAAAAIFHGNAHVMNDYHMRGNDGVEQAPDHGLPAIEAAKQPEMEQERGGRE
jgi:hypothetical protein